MKVLHITPSFYPASVYGGTSESVLQLCRELGRAGNEVRVLTTNANGTDVLDIDADADVQLDPIIVRYCSRTACDSVSVNLLARLLSAARWADVIHLHAVYSFPTFPSLIAARMAKRPLVWSPRGALQRWSKSSRTGAKALWEAGCRLVGAPGIVLHATSDVEARACSDRFSFRTVVIPNGVAVPANDPLRTRVQELRLAYLGRLHPIKGLENLIDAAAILAKTASFRWSLRIGGQGDRQYEGQLRARIASLGLSGRVHLVGHVDSSTKTRFFEESDLLIAPSHSENFGIVIAEALAHGLPVVVSRGTPWARVEEMGCGLWVANDADSLSAAIVRLSQLDLSALGGRGRLWMLREYQWTDIASRMQALYEEITHATIGRAA